MPALIIVGVVLLVMLVSTKTFGYVAGHQVELELAPIGSGFYLRRDAAAAFLEMKLAAAADGVKLVPNDAFRTMTQQEAAYAKYLAGGNLAAQPGHSNHQGGIAVDIESGGGMNASFVWLTNNARRFGFRRTVASEPWHWEYSA